MFVPSTEGAFDTGYFMSRYVWNPEEDHVFGASDFDYMSESCSDTFSSGSLSNAADEDVSSICNTEYEYIIYSCLTSSSKDNKIEFF